MDVSSDAALDEGPEVEATAKKDAADMTGTIGGDLRRNKLTIEGMADTASKLEADRSGSEAETGAKKSLEEGKQQVGSQFEGLTRSISKNLKEGIDASRPSLEELSRTASKGVKAGRENLDYAAEGAAEISGDAQEVLDGAKGALDKRLKVINLAAEDARETGNMVAELATKGWDKLTKSTERFLGNFQENVGDLQATVQEKAQEAKLKAEETAEQAQSKFVEAKITVQAKTDELKNTAQQKTSESKSKLEDTAEEAQSKFGEAKDNAQAKTNELKDRAQSKFGEAKDNVQTKTEELKDTAQEKASESKSKVEGAAESSGSVIGQTPSNRNGESKGPKSSVVGQTPGADASVQYADSGKVNDEWKGKSQ